MADEAADGFTGAILGVRELKSALRRRRRVWIGLGLTGLIIGAAIHVVFPKTYTADAHLYLVEPFGIGPDVAMSNDVSLLQTRAVEQQVPNYLAPQHADNTHVSYKGRALSDSILSVSATGTSPAEAVAKDNAVAHAFLAVRADELKRQIDLIVGTLDSQIAAQPEGSAQITNLRSGILTAQASLRSTTEGSFIIDPARAASPRTKKAVLMDMLAGLIGGLALGGGVVVIGEMLSDRARRREDVAAALGVEVELSVPRFRVRRWVRGRRKLREFGRTPAMVERRLRAHLEAVSRRSLAVFAVNAERVSTLAISRLATSLVLEGRSVLVLDMAEGRPIARRFDLKAGQEPLHRVDLHGGSFTVVVSPDDPARAIGPLKTVQYDDVLVLASVDPAFGVEHVSSWARDGVCIVRSGKPTRVGLDGAGRMIRQGGIALRSCILVGADPDDESIGLLEPVAAPSLNGHVIDVVSAGDW